MADNLATAFFAPRLLVWSSFHIHRPEDGRAQAVSYPWGKLDIAPDRACKSACSFIFSEMTSSSEKVRNLVWRRLELLAAELGRPQLAETSADTHLLGGQSPLDSIGLVTLIADLEGDIQNEFGKTVLLADEKAMSLTLSPFRKVGTLVEYIEAKLKE